MSRWGDKGCPGFLAFSVWASRAHWVDSDQCMAEGGLQFIFFIRVVRFWFVHWFFSGCDVDVCCVDFATEGS